MAKVHRFEGQIYAGTGSLTDNGSINFLFGEGLLVNQNTQYNALFGKNNWTQNLNGNILAGENNFAGCGYNAVFGYNNANGAAVMSYNLLVGEGHRVTNDHNLVAGKNNIVASAAVNTLSGEDLYSTGGASYNAIFGRDNGMNFSSYHP